MVGNAGWERVINTLSVRRPQPHKGHNTNPKIRERKNSRRQKGNEQLRPIKRHCPCSWNRSVPHHRILGHRYRSTEILTWNKGPAALRDTSARRRIIKPMYAQIIACNPHWHIKTQVEHHKEGASVYTWSLQHRIILPRIDRRSAMSHSNLPQLKNWHHWLHGPVV